MSKALAVLLANDHPLFTYNLDQLEKAIGDDSVASRLVADVLASGHEVMRRLSLDTADTSAEELYQALNHATSRTDVQEVFSGAHYVLQVIDSQLISFCLYDSIENAHHQLPFSQRKVDHAQRFLRAEIIKRYAEHDRTDNNLVQELAKQAKISLSSDAHFAHIDQLLLTANIVEPSQHKLPYILAVGDIFTDAFIKLNEHVARIDTDENGEKRISLPLGSKPPYDEVDIVRAVGPSPNAAVALSRLGLRVGLDSFIGDDEVGKEAIEYLKSENIDTDTMLVEKGFKTSYYFVLRYGAERTILVKNEQFDYRWDPPKEVPEWIYLALMSDASWEYHEALADYLVANPSIKLAFQPGTFHFDWGVDKLARIYKRAEILILNREEAVGVTGKSYDSLPDLFAGLHELGPKIAVITDGPNGSYASYDGKIISIRNYPDPGPPVDRTGAGDAFASTIVGALAHGETMDTALLWAPINSMNVVQHLGAQKGLLRLQDIKKYLDEAPEDYTVKTL